MTRISRCRVLSAAMILRRPRILACQVISFFTFWAFLFKLCICILFTWFVIVYEKVFICFSARTHKFGRQGQAADDSDDGGSGYGSYSYGNNTSYNDDDDDDSEEESGESDDSTSDSQSDDNDA